MVWWGVVLPSLVGAFKVALAESGHEKGVYYKGTFVGSALMALAAVSDSQ